MKKSFTFAAGFVVMIVACRAQTAPVVEINSSGNVAITSKANHHALYARTSYIPVYSSAAGTSIYTQEGVRGEINADASNPYNQYLGIVGLGKNASPIGGMAAYNVGVFGSGKHGIWGKSSETFGYGVFGDGHTGVAGVSNTGGIGVQGISYGGGLAGMFLGKVNISDYLGVGLSSTYADFMLDVNGRARIRSGGTDEVSAGVWFNNNANNALQAFIGMRIDNEFGIFSQSMAQWLMRFNVTTGAICAFSAITSCSDQRLKTNLSLLEGSLQKLSRLQGFHYQWIKHPTMGMQTGLLAQEVQKIFPELVETDADGYLSVNYVGLIPHLIESLKELQTKNKIVEAQVQEMKQLESRLLKLEAALSQTSSRESKKGCNSKLRSTIS